RGFENTGVDAPAEMLRMGGGHPSDDALPRLGQHVLKGGEVEVGGLRRSLGRGRRMAAHGHLPPLRVSPPGSGSWSASASWSMPPPTAMWWPPLTYWPHLPAPSPRSAWQTLPGSTS